MNKKLIGLIIILLVVFTGATFTTGIAKAQQSATDVTTIINQDQYERIGYVKKFVQNDENRQKYPELYSSADKWLNNSQRADQYDYIDSINNNPNGDYNTIIADVSNNINVVSYSYDDGRTSIVIDSDGSNNVEIVYAENRKLYKESFTVGNGLTSVQIEGRYDSVNVWHDNTGAIVSGGGGITLYERVVSDPSYDTLYIITISSVIFTIISLIVWTLRQKYKNRTTIKEIIYKRDEYKLSNTNTKYERFINRLKQIWSIKYGIGITSILGVAIYYFNITIPTWLYIAGVSGIIVIPIVYAIAPKVNDYIGLISESYDIYVSTNPEIEDQDVPFKAYRISSNSTDHITIHNERRTFTLNGITVHICDYFNPEEQVGYAGDYTSIKEELWFSLREAAYESRRRRNVLKQFAIQTRREINRVINEVSLIHHNNLIEKENEMDNYDGEDVNEIIKSKLPKYRQLTEEENYLDDDLQERIDSKTDDDDQNNQNGDNDE